MDSLLGYLSGGLLLIGALCINFAEGHRTPGSRAQDREARRHIGWYFTRRSYSLDEFDDAGRRAFHVGRILVFAAAVGIVGLSILKRY
jgi:hypothetical protein